MPIDGTAFMTPEEIDELKTRIARAKQEFTGVYGLKWTFPPPQKPRRALVHVEDLRANVCDHGPLSYWSIEQPHAQGGGWRTLDSGEVVAFEVGVVEAMEALCKVLDARAAAAAEALKDPEPTGFTTLPGAFAVGAPSPPTKLPAVAGAYGFYGGLVPTPPAVAPLVAPAPGPPPPPTAPPPAGSGDEP